MKIWGTTIYAKCPFDGIIKEYGGPNIKAPSRQLAFDYCQNNGLGYCHIQDEIVMEIPCKKGTHEPDWDNAIDYDAQQNN